MKKRKIIIIVILVLVITSISGFCLYKSYESNKKKKEEPKTLEVAETEENKEEKIEEESEEEITEEEEETKEVEEETKEVEEEKKEETKKEDTTTNKENKNNNNNKTNTSNNNSSKKNNTNQNAGTTNANQGTANNTNSNTNTNCVINVPYTGFIANNTYDSDYDKWAQEQNRVIKYIRANNSIDVMLTSSHAVGYTKEVYDSCGQRVAYLLTVRARLYGSKAIVEPQENGDIVCIQNCDSDVEHAVEYYLDHTGAIVVTSNPYGLDFMPSGYRWK